MSSFQDKHDIALLDSPWLTKAIDGESWLFKYAPDPERAGYIFLATDLTRIYFESLNAPSIPSRLSELVSHKSKSKQKSQSDARHVVAQSEELLRDLGEWCGEKWDEVEMTVRPDHFYDKIFGLKASDFQWEFNVAELDLRRCVPLLAKHLLLPMAKGLASAHDLKITAKASPAAAIAKVLSDESVARATQPAGPSRSKATANVKASPQKAKAPEPVEEDEAESPEEQEEETQDYVSGSEQEPEVEETLPLPSAQKSPSTKKRRTRISSESSGTAESPKEGKGVEPDENAEKFSDGSPDEAQEDEHESEETEDSEAKVAETLPKSQHKPSQKSKKEREKEEEEEVERRREEMKRKMEHGGGGRLGKRRLRR